MALMQMTVIPIGTPTPSIGDYIAEVVKVLDREGASYELSDMGTIIEAGTDELFTLARELHEVPFAKGIQRVVTIIEIDDRRDKKVGMGDKVRSVMARIK